MVYYAVDTFQADEVVDTGRRARRSAATAANVAMSYLTETEEQIDSVYFGTRKMAAPVVSGYFLEPGKIYNLLKLKSNFGVEFCSWGVNIGIQY